MQLRVHKWLGPQALFPRLWLTWVGRMWYSPAKLELFQNAAAVWSGFTQPFFLHRLNALLSVLMVIIKGWRKSTNQSCNWPKNVEDNKHVTAFSQNMIGKYDVLIETPAEKTLFWTQFRSVLGLDCLFTKIFDPRFCINYSSISDVINVTCC